MSPMVAARILRATRYYPWKLAGVPVLVAVLVGWLLLSIDSRPTVLVWTFDLAAISALAVSFWWVGDRLAPAVGSRAWVGRRDDESVTAGGMASALDVVEHCGPAAMRAKATTVRPSLKGEALRSLPLTAYSVPVAKVGWLPWGSTVYSPCEQHTIRIGGPRMGKSGSLACHILDAPGALLCTSSRGDLLDLTEAARRRVGQVDTFNPTGLGGIASTVRWSPLAGCEDFGTAQRRAVDLIPASTGEGERWDAQARGLLAILMHAAALADRSMLAVLGWISPADADSLREVVAALSGSESSRALTAEVRSVYSTNDRTLTSITSTMLPALRWLTNATAAQVGDACITEPDFLDVRALVDGGSGSLYLIGRDGPARPLLAALTAEVAHHVRMVAAAASGGRLDPPMTAVLDEAPLVCGAVPLHDWSADMGGRGLTLHIGAQSLSQLRDVWGSDRAATIVSNCGTLLVFGGITDDGDLSRISTSAGGRLMALDPDDRRFVPVMSPGDIRALPAGQVLVLRAGLRPAVGSAPMAWDRASGGAK